MFCIVYVFMSIYVCSICWCTCRRKSERLSYTYRWLAKVLMVEVKIIVSDPSNLLDTDQPENALKFNGNASNYRIPYL